MAELIFGKKKKIICNIPDDISSFTKCLTYNKYAIK